MRLSVLVYVELGTPAQFLDNFVFPVPAEDGFDYFPVASAKNPTQWLPNCQENRDPERAFTA